jgi:putative tryptophan/tyrosine transport system substrate-binding protein
MRKLLIGGAVGALVLAFSAVLFTAFYGSNPDDASAQSVRRVGMLHVGTDHIPPALKPFKARLKELGWTQGKNIELVFRNLEPEQVEAQAAAFVNQGVDVIVAFEDQSIDAAQKATSGRRPATARTRDRIPVVFLHPSDPLRDGLATSLSRPGGNMTGVFGPRDVVAKQLEVYQALVPRLRRVLTLVDPKDKRTKRTLTDFEGAVAQLERPLELVIREATTADDLERVFKSLRPGEVDGAFLLSNNLRQNHSALTIKLAREADLPVQGSRKEWVEQGALFSYGADLGPLGRAGARHVDSILRGASPSDLPVEDIRKPQFAINLKTATRLGIKVPQEMIIRADPVYR